MKAIIFLLFFLNISLIHAQNKFKDISDKRLEISKFVFDEVLDKNTFNSSIVTKNIFKRRDLTIYSIKTYSPHALLNIAIFYKKKVKLFCIEDKTDIKKPISFLKENNISNDNLKIIEQKIQNKFTPIQDL